MTYGENGAQIRSALTTLLRQHRIQHRLGGPGNQSVHATTNPDERAALAGQILRYRRSALTWCHQAATAAVIHAGSDPFDEPNIGRLPSTPFEELQHGLRKALDSSAGCLPTLDELTTRQQYGLVETWRQLARAAALGEHDFDSMRSGRMPVTQAMAVLEDVAAITQALVALDRRYARTPGWERLDRSGRLGWAALATALEATHEGADYTVDGRGWRPPARLITGPARPGLLGVLQAEHNLLIRLTRGFPSPLNLKLVVDSQRQLSFHLAARIHDSEPETAARWSARAQTYQAVHRELRNVGGRTGKGARTAVEAATTLSRLRRVAHNTEIDPRVLNGFDKLFTHLDHRVADHIEHGIAKNLLFLRTRVPRTVDIDDEEAIPADEHFVPLDSPIQTDLPRIVREQLRPHSPAATFDAVAVRSRRDLHTALLHRPIRHDRGITI